MTELTDELSRLRNALASGRHEHADISATVAEGWARKTLSDRGGRSWLGRVFGIDPATVYLIVQLVLLVLELVRQLRALRRPS